MNIKYIDHMGSDEQIIKLSRVCIDKETKGPLTLAKQQKLIDGLVSRGHWSCFDQSYVTYEIEVPIYVARQWMRHNAAYMEKSLRYTKNPKLQKFSHGIKPYGGLSDYIDIIGGYDMGCDPIWAYEELLDRDFKPEDARRVLPLETLTTIVITTSLRDAFFLISQRLDSHAQNETRELALAFLDMLANIFPISIAAYLKFEFQSFKMSITDLQEVTYYMEHGGFKDDKKSYDVVRRFIDNAKNRIRVVSRTADFLARPREDTEADGRDMQLQFDFD